MKQHLVPFIVAFLAVIAALIVYNMFISGSSWFGHYEGSNNYDVDDECNILQNGMRVAV
jgi:hypothetical protein